MYRRCAEMAHRHVNIGCRKLNLDALNARDTPFHPIKRARLQKYNDGEAFEVFFGGVAGKLRHPARDELCPDCVLLFGVGAVI